MNRINIEAGTPGLILEAKKFEQDSILNAFKMISSAYTALSINFIISGCESTIDTIAGVDTVQLNAGVASYQGEPVVVEAQTLTKSVGEVCWLEIKEETVNSVSYQNEEGQPVDVEIKRSMVLKKGDNYPAAADHLKLDADNQAELIARLLGARIVQRGAILEVHNWELTWFDSTGLGLPDTRADGYAICNGLNGTPDKRGVTAVGAVQVPSNGAGGLPMGVTSNYQVGDVFGTEKHQLTVAELPAHTHDFQGTSLEFTANTGAIQNGDGHTRTYPTKTTQSTGADTPHENRQPSRAALFVMVL